MVHTQSKVDIAGGLSALSGLLDQIPTNSDWNEAQTRYHFIDILIEQCLGWDRQNDVEVEHSLNKSYADYVLGHPQSLVIEAKREGVYFELPANASGKLRQSLASLMALSEPLKKAIIQVQQYCAQRGIIYAAICNGHQLIAFVGVKIGAAPLSGDALVIDSLESMKKNFPIIWQMLSPDGIQEHKLRKYLDTDAAEVPKKLSSKIPNPAEFRYKSDLNSNLRTLGELLLEDIPKSQEIESQFLEECYVSSKDLERYSLLSRKVIASRYNEFVREHAKGASADAIDSRIEVGEGVAPVIKSEFLADALSRRPMILLGDVGVGKTTFLRNLMLRSAKAEFSNSIFIYIDLGTNASLSVDIRSYILGQIEDQIRIRYTIDIQERNFVRGVYDLDIKRFRSSVFGDLYENNREQYDARVMDMLVKRIDDRAEHVKNSIRHVALGRKKQIIFILDNCDQRTFQVQQDAFTIAQDMSENWNAIVFLTLRPQTFYQSKLTGVLSAYPNRILTVSPPPIEAILNRRIDFAIRLAQGEVTSQALTNIRMSLSQITLFLSAMLRSIRSENDLKIFLSNITGGNVRAVIELITKFCGSPNVDAKKIIGFEEKSVRYKIPLHEFTKHALLGEYSYFNPHSSTVAVNLFDVLQSDEREHFLAGLILGYCDFVGPHRDKDSFVLLTQIVKEMQSSGFTPAQIEWQIRKLAARNLIEAVERISLQAEEELEGLALSAKYRITSIGTYHVRIWIGTFAYLEAVSVDTPLFDKELLTSLESTLNIFDIRPRLLRATKFRSYLTNKWNAAGIQKPYFDWPKIVVSGENQFEKVRIAAAK